LDAEDKIVKRLLAALVLGVICSLITTYLSAAVIEFDVVIDIPVAGSMQTSLATHTPVTPFTVQNGDTVRVTASFSDDRRIMYPNDPIDSEEFMFAAIAGAVRGDYDTQGSDRSFTFTGLEGDFAPDMVTTRPGNCGFTGCNTLSIFIIENLTDSSFVFDGFVWELADIGPLDALPATFGEFEFNLNAGGAQFTILGPIPIPATVWLFGSALGMLGWMKRKSV